MAPGPGRARMPECRHKNGQYKRHLANGKVCASVCVGLGQGGAASPRCRALLGVGRGITLSLLSRKTGVYLGAARYGTGDGG